VEILSNICFGPDPVEQYQALALNGPNPRQLEVARGPRLNRHTCWCATATVTPVPAGPQLPTVPTATIFGSNHVRVAFLSHVVPWPSSSPPLHSPPHVPISSSCELHRTRRAPLFSLPLPLSVQALPLVNCSRGSLSSHAVFMSTVLQGSYPEAPSRRALISTASPSTATTTSDHHLGPPSPP
jgi:hypothetical protein